MLTCATAAHLLQKGPRLCRVQLCKMAKGPDMLLSSALPYALLHAILHC